MPRRRRSRLPSNGVSINHLANPPAACGLAGECQAASGKIREVRSFVMKPLLRIIYISGLFISPGCSSGDADKKDNVDATKDTHVPPDSSGPRLRRPTTKKNNPKR